MIALGTDITGAMGNDDALVRRDRGGRRRGRASRSWQLPLHEEYRRLIDSNDRRHQEHRRPVGGAITAAWFLAEFVGDVPWVHLDIAGTGFLRERQRPGSEGRHGRPRSRARPVRARPGGVTAGRGPGPADGSGPRRLRPSGRRRDLAGGTMAKWAAAGREVHLLILTNGDRGSQDPRADRRSSRRHGCARPRRPPCPGPGQRPGRASTTASSRTRERCARPSSAGSARSAPRPCWPATRPPCSSRTGTTTTRTTGPPG